MKKKTCLYVSTCKAKKKSLFHKRGYPILECEQCQFRFLEISDASTHLSTVYADHYFFEGDEYPNYLNQESILYNYGIRYAKIVSRFTKPGKVLDVGCAAGFILNGFNQAGWDCYGIEPNETMVNYGKFKLGLNIQVGNIENFTVNNQKFDLVILIQLIGHLYNVDKALENINSILNVNGLILVESWNMKSLVARLLGKRWHEYNPPSVVNWFSSKTLKEVFNSHGFELIAKGRPAKKINIEHALNFYQNKQPHFPFKKSLFKFLQRSMGKLNIVYPPVDLKWYIFKKK